MEPVIQESSEDDVFPAEKVVKQRICDGKPEYLIKWLEFPASHTKAENILDERLFMQFYKKHPRSRRFDDDPDYNPRIAVLS